MLNSTYELFQKQEKKTWAKPQLIALDSDISDVEMPMTGPAMEGINTADS